VARSAPAFLLETPNGEQLTLHTYTGRPLVLNVFASWCPPCRMELPRIAAASRRSAGRIAFVGVDEQEPLEMALAFVRRMKLPYPIAIDHGQFAASYGATSLPETVFIDAHGVVRAIKHGTISQAELHADLTRIANAAGEV